MYLPAGQYASPYLGMGNNPISRIDPDGGMDGDCCDDPIANAINTSLGNTTQGEHTHGGWGSMKIDPKGYVTRKYGVAPYEWAGYLNRSGGQAVKDIFNSLGSSGNVSSSELYTIAVGEGFYHTHLSTQGYGLSNSVSGFMSLGIDHFGSDRNNLVAGGFLPSSFNQGDEYTLDSNTNEWGESVTSANFKNIRSGLTAFSAVTNERRHLVEVHGTNLGYGAPTEDQLFFWTYYYFQGQGRGQRVLTNNGSWSISGMSFDTTSQNPRGVGSLAYRRLATWRYTQLKGY